MNEPAVERAFPSSKSATGCFGVVAVVLSIFFLGVGVAIAWIAISAVPDPSQPFSVVTYALATSALIGGTLPALWTRRLMRTWKQPVLVLDAAGVRAPHEGKLVPWAEIASATIDSRGETILLRLEPRRADRDRTLGWLLGTSTNIALDLSGGRSDEILAAVRSHPSYRGDDAHRA